MKVGLGQFAVARDWQENAATCAQLMQQAAQAQADLLVLPEAVLARDNADPDWGVNAAQPLDGPFMQRLLAQSRGQALTTLFTLHVPDGRDRVCNTLVALRDGDIVARYDKLHLYDAFAVQESRRVSAGQTLPALLSVGGMKVGLMTCYDVRFPELARRLALDGAEVLVLPSAWVRGPLKEHHWQVLVAARALENTCYMVAVGECGPRNIGSSRVVDPLGVTIACAAEAPALLFAELSRERLAEVRDRLPVLANRRFALPQLQGGSADCQAQ
ncbi:deaminated glutathione amidase [Pantoea sp. 1.19]|uniref:deaminated glutathione amidase n=1 Tax=Pantoea sp. 1.19 TaxID=1925589 RepID=UPI000948EC1A|nr:deaminated glutathione amidase [Pantoea sp. 1.19]